MTTLTWQLLTQLDHLHELQAQRNCAASTQTSPVVVDGVLRATEAEAEEKASRRWGVGRSGPSSADESGSGRPPLEMA